MELWNHLCPGCMREIKEKNTRSSVKDERNVEKSAGRGQADFRCPYCGFSESGYKQNPRCLPLNTILAGKYLVGKVLGEGGFGITYMGYDLNMKTRIAIKEYFPVELVSRDTTPSHLAGRKARFRRRKRPCDLLKRREKQNLSAGPEKIRERGP